MTGKSLLLCLTTLVCCISSPSRAQDSSRWGLTADGGIEWQVKHGDTHMDHIEMSGLKLSSIVHYGVQDGKLQQSVQLVFPMLRTIPNDTHGSYSEEINSEELGRIKIDGRVVEEEPQLFYIKGILSYQSEPVEGLLIRHHLFPSVDKAVFLDRTEILNTSSRAITLELPEVRLKRSTDPSKGVEGAYELSVYSDKSGNFVLEANETLHYTLVYKGQKAGTAKACISPAYEEARRKKLIDETFSSLVFESPDSVLNLAFAFAKLRAVESIYDTKGGLMHGPGGGRYYAAIWANDQAEYANPFFPFLGNPEGNESAINAFRHFARFMNPEYKAIPSSIIAEGTDTWNGAGDRGDMAMIAYGAGRFALASGNEETARELWPLIEWCLEYCRRKVTGQGVVSSDSDELEGRFPAGTANLNTSCLYYDALRSAGYLGSQLGVSPSILDSYSQQALDLEQAIEAYFGYTVEGYETYRYYEGNEQLRAWICTPLTVDIFRRSRGTIDALFSDQLWTDDGLASLSGSTTFWDRATLYALRGVFAAGETQRAMSYMQYYSKRRLLGEHVPYPVEAYPEGNQRHLSAESALYCRIITEGLFGIRPCGLDSFTLSPKLPEGWDAMALRNIKAFSSDFSIEVRRSNGGLALKVFSGEELWYEGWMEEGGVGVGVSLR